MVHLHSPSVGLPARLGGSAPCETNRRSNFGFYSHEEPSSRITTEKRVSMLGTDVNATRTPNQSNNNSQAVMLVSGSGAALAKPIDFGFRPTSRSSTA